MVVNEFKHEVIEKLDWYVYRLVDPRNGETFYIGKGSGNRVFQHLKQENSLNNFDLDNDSSEANVDLKYTKIREIKNSGVEVCCVIHRHGLDEKSALLVEAALIDAYPELTNKQNGHGSNDYGIMTLKQIVDKYSLKELSQDDLANYKIMMIKINRSFQDDVDIYSATRFAWVINQERANKAEYVFSVNKGIVVGIFKVEPNSWKQANRENFPELPRVENLNRYAFSGEQLNSSSKEYELFYNKRIPSKYRKLGSSNPILYNYT